MNEEALYTPVRLGTDAATNETVYWPWSEEAHSTMTIIGSPTSSRKQLIDQLISDIQKQDADSVYHISTSREVIGVSIDNDAIIWTEKLPDPGEEFEDRDIFINNRRYFSTSYFNLIAQGRGITRAELLPGTSYRWHAEGPLNGYIRTIHELEEDNPNKSLLIHELEKLESVQWYKSKEMGTVFHLEHDDNVHILALSFLRAVWSYWAIVGKLDSPQQMLLVVDVPTELLDISLDPAIAEIVDFCFNILRFLANETTVTLLFSSEMMYPAPEKGFRHKIVFSASPKTDFDLNSDSIKPAIAPLLFEKWESGENSAGIHFDDGLNVQTVLVPVVG